MSVSYKETLCSDFESLDIDRIIDRIPDPNTNPTQKKTFEKIFCVAAKK